MDFASDNLIVRVLLTINTIGYSAIPVLADFNKTHATNPLWTPHARFHVVWQVLSYCGVGLIALWLIWSAGPAVKLWLAVALAVAMYAAFFVGITTAALGMLSAPNWWPTVESASTRTGNGSACSLANWRAVSLSSLVM